MLNNKSQLQYKIFNSVQNKIFSGELKPGEKLSENSLAEEFQCSRMPVREAVKKLEQAGLVVIQPKSGTYVKVYTEQEAKEIIEIRAYLEALAFSLIIEKDKDITPMKENLAAMEKIMTTEPFDLVKFGKYHFQFHSNLVKLSDNQFLITYYDKLHLHSVYKIFYSPMTKEDVILTHTEHEKIVKLLTDKDETGRDFIIHHLMKRRETLK